MRLLVLCLLAPLCAQDVTSVSLAMKTGGYFNGRFWNSQSREGKATYLYGAMESIPEVPMSALKTCACAIDAGTNAMKLLFGEKANPVPIEVIELMDTFFREPANRQIPMIEALKYVAEKLSGASRQRLEELETTLRRDAARLQ